MLRSLLSVALVASFAATASAQCATTTASNNAGEITLSFDGSAPMNFAFFVVGDTTGTTPVAIGSLLSFDLGLEGTFYPVPAGLTDLNGDASITFTAPSTLTGTFYAQGLSIGLSFGGGGGPGGGGGGGGGGFGLSACVGDVASFTL